MQAFRQFIEKYSSVPRDEWNIIKQVFEYREFEKNEIIVNEGSICRYFWFLEKGLVRFFVNNDGQDVTKFFTVAPYCFTSKESFRNKKPSTESIQALEKTITWQTNHDNANELLKLKSWNNFTRRFIHEVQVYTEELLIESKTRTAEERYKILCKQYPVLIQKIPLKYLSSFLGIAPQSLSRIRQKEKIIELT